MSAPLLIVGQGVAGTMLAWQLEQAGVDFRIVDAGHAQATSRIAGGLVNPVTGLRLAKSWQAEELLPLARESYLALGAAIGASVWRDVRIRRLFRGASERALFERRRTEGDLGPFLGASDEEGFWIEGAGCVDLPALLAAARARWKDLGILEERRFTDADWGTPAIHCTGASVRALTPLVGVPWQVSRGELLTVEAAGLDPGVVLSRVHWVLPVEGNRARVGASYSRDTDASRPTDTARTILGRSASDLLGRPFSVIDHEAGLRLALPDKRPLAGWIPGRTDVGVCTALGSKGVLWAPWLARQWRRCLCAGEPFDPEVAIERRLAKPVSANG